MANSFFRFKEFTVNQEGCAMKVCTDACLQGAYTAWYAEGNGLVSDDGSSENGLVSADGSLENGLVSADDSSGNGLVSADGSLENGLVRADGSSTHELPALRILDIGAGTGLLSLMLAQRLLNATITGVELDAVAAEQAKSNILGSPWYDRISLLTGDARSLSLNAPYDLIITNPPFYEGDLKSPDQLRNQAMHTTTLNYEELLNIINKHLSPGGVFSILLPYTPFATFEALATQKGFFPHQVLHVKQSVRHDRFRTIAIFGRTAKPRAEDTMAIKEEGNEYTAAFKTLLQPYYLYL